jgi:methyl acetate hydrolase
MIQPVCFLLPLLMIAVCGCTGKRDTAALDRVLSGAVEKKMVPGVVAMAATTDGIIYEGSAGFAKDTIFAIASMTKPVTSVAVMQLVEEGKVKLDEPASTYVAELGKVQVLENGKLRPPKSPVTVRQLLSHTAGFGYEFMNKTLFDEVGKGTLKSFLAGGDAFLQAPLLFDPGAQWEYGISTDWLGRLVERISGQGLDVYCKRKIFDPLGMPDTFFVVPEGKKARQAKLYQRKADGSLALQPEEPVLNAGGFLSGGGGLFSTAADYLRFSRALLGGGTLEQRRILKAESVEAMGRNQIGELTLHPFRSFIPNLATDNAVLPGGLDKFGLGFALNTKALGNDRSANTMSWAGIFNTFFWVDREKKVCAVLMTQMSPGMDKGPAQLMKDYEAAVYSWLK